MPGCDRGGSSAAGGAAGKTWLSGFGRGPAACSACGGAADPGCPSCDGTGVCLSELGFVDDDDKKAKTKSKKKRERKARAKAAKKCQDEHGGVGLGPEITAEAVAGVGAAGGKCNGHGGIANAIANANANDRADHEVHGRGSSFRQGKIPDQQLLKPKSADPAPSRSREGGATTAAAAAVARQRAGSSGIESAGSLLSMLDDSNGRVGSGGHADDGDEGIDEDLMREMERLRNQKASMGVQRTRAALRFNLQKNFDQLLVSSTTRQAEGKV